MAQAGLLSPMWLKAGEVAGQLTGGRVDFFGQQADVVEVGDGTLEDVPRPRGLAGQGQGLAWTSQKVHSTKVPSRPSRPSAPPRVSYR
jgi:hypothetical protein